MYGEAIAALLGVVTGWGLNFFQQNLDRKREERLLGRMLGSEVFFEAAKANIQAKAFEKAASLLAGGTLFTSLDSAARPWVTAYQANLNRLSSLDPQVVDKLQVFYDRLGDFYTASERASQYASDLRNGKKVAQGFAERLDHCINIYSELNALVDPLLEALRQLYAPSEPKIWKPSTGTPNQ